MTKLRKFSTSYCLIMFQTLLGTTEGFHKYLQGENVDLAQAVYFKDAVHSALRDMRTNESAAQLYEKTTAFCLDNDIPEPATEPRRKQKRMDDFVVESSCGANVVDLSTSEHLRNNLYFPCLDRMLNELDCRFSEVNADVMNGIQACNPLSDNFLSEQSLKELAKHYKMQLLTEEVLVAKNYIGRRKEAGDIADTQTVYKLLDPQMFPSLKKIMQVALTLPVSSCSCERSFSVLRRLHTWLRVTMGQTRLQHLAVMSVEKSVLESIEEDAIINRFANMHKRRYSLIPRPPPQ